MSKQRIDALDGLRGIAALTVFAQHFSTDAPWSPTLDRAGIVGVMLFFVLSGFLMGRLYGEEPFTRVAVTNFWVKRVARVVPLFFICVTAAYAWLWMTGENRPFYLVHWQGWWLHYVFVDGQSIFWTIPREMQFYLVFPLIWWLCGRLGNAALFLVLAVAAICQVAAIQQPVFMQVAQLFLVGVVAGRVHLKTDRAYDVPFVALLALYVLSWPGIIDAIGLPSRLYGNIIQGPLYLVYLPALVLVTTASPLAQRMLGQGIMKRYGEVSYSLYMLHAPVYFALKLWTPISLLPTPVWFLLTLVAVTIVSNLSFDYVETPLRRWVSGLAPRSSSARLVDKPVGA